MAFVAGSWGVSCALLAVNSVLSIIIAAIAGWAFNQNLDQAMDHVVFRGKSMSEVFFIKEVHSWSAMRVKFACKDSVVMTGTQSFRLGGTNPKKV